MDAVEPFLFNLFYDPAIIALPNPLRYFLAKLISKRRAPIAREIYGHMGGKSPILANTEDQVKGLRNHFSDNVDFYIAMRYWHPRAEKVASEICKKSYDRVIVLPLYPQYSTTTTESSYLEMKKALESKGYKGKIQLICCYPDHRGWIEACQMLIQKALNDRPKNLPCQLVLTAHGLPEAVVRRGDPYQRQVEETAKKIIQGLDLGDADWILSYQSRVGPMKWIGPCTEKVIEEASLKGVGLVVYPLAFVSEHSETLVELDIEYEELAKKSGAPYYHRVPTVSCHESFLSALQDLLNNAMDSEEAVVFPASPCCGDQRKCGRRFG